MRLRLIWALGYCAILNTAAVFSADNPKFKEIGIEKRFEPYVLGNPLLMEVAGAKVIKLKNGSTVVLSIASTVLKNDSAKDRLRAERVCHTKALAGVVAEKKGVQVYHTEELNEKTTVVEDKDGESGESVSEFLQITRTKVEGITKDMPVVGRWKSKDGKVFYLAIGTILDKSGEVVEEEG